jgi:hypothetical protein
MTNSNPPVPAQPEPEETDRVNKTVMLVIGVMLVLPAIIRVVFL